VAVKNKEGTMKGQEVQFVKGEPPKKRVGGEGKWANHLLPLLDRPGIWALVWTCENIDQAMKLQGNLSQRAVFIPEPKHHWEFVARGCEVYAVYRGKKRGSDASLRRANRRG